MLGKDPGKATIILFSVVSETKTPLKEHSWPLSQMGQPAEKGVTCWIPPCWLGRVATITFGSSTRTQTHPAPTSKAPQGLGAEHPLSGQLSLCPQPSTLSVNRRCHHH